MTGNRRGGAAEEGGAGGPAIRQFAAAVVYMPGAVLSGQPALEFHIGERGGSVGVFTQQRRLSPGAENAKHAVHAFAVIAGKQGRREIVPGKAAKRINCAAERRTQREAVHPLKENAVHLVGKKRFGQVP